MISLWLLQRELRLWSANGRRPQLWWRDDDAVAITPGLIRLVDIAERWDIPLALAVVPGGVDDTLQGFLDKRPLLSVIQHGTDHQNARPQTQPSQFAADAPAEAITRAIADGARRLSAFAGWQPIYVPPWNDLQPNVLKVLPAAGLLGVSASGGLALQQPLPRWDSHIDLMRWREPVRFVGRGRILTRLRLQLASRRQQGRWDEPIGILTHHLVHDEAAWRFLAQLLEWQPLAKIAVWRRCREMFGVNA